MLPSRALAFLVCVLACAFPAAAAADVEVELKSTGFSPSKVTVDAGETLHFVNQTGGTWTVESATGAFDSGTLQPNASFTMKVSVPGRHTFRSDAQNTAQGTLTVLARTLPGNAADDAAAQIPSMPFPGVDPDDVDSHPDFGVQASRTRIMLGFKPGATVAEANQALEAAEVRIIGGLPTLGTLLVQTESAEWGGSWWNLEQTLARLRSSKAVLFAAMSTAAEPLAVPRRADSAVESAPGGFEWNFPIQTGAWAPMAAQFPEAWNLKEAIDRKRPQVVTGIVDAGFEPHEDLPGLEIQSILCPSGGDCRFLTNSPDSVGHGNHVAGIIGAAYDNASDEAGRAKGVNGGNPHARMFGYSTHGFRDFDPGEVGNSTLNDKNLELFDLILRSRPATMRVINYSMGASAFDGADWQSEFGDKLCGPGSRDDDLPDHAAPIKEPCTPNNQDDWQREIAAVGMAAAPVARAAAQAGVMIVQAAGNDGLTFCPNGVCAPIDTASRNEFSWVSRNWGQPVVNPNGLPNPILTVQASTREGGPRDDTTFGADVAAPGHQIVSTVLDDGYGVLGGSSMAAPQVTALVGMMLADDPSLTLEQIRRRVLDWAGPRPTIGPIDFKWSMPDKMNRDVNGDGVVDYPRSKVVIAPTNYQVDLDACDASANGKVPAAFTWKADGQEIGTTSECVYRWRPAAEGTYSVELTVTGAEGDSQSVTKQVEVEDLLVVSVGDSIASGEGDPDIESPYSVWQEARCHRSAFGGPAQAARLLEAADVKTAVTFLHLACSGARMTGDLDENGNPMTGPLGIGGLLTPYEGVVPNNDDCENTGRISWDYCEPPQLDRAKQLVGDRVPDALTVSIGANDMRFSTILTYCMKPFNACDIDPEGRGLFEERIKLLEARYAAVAAKIKALWPTLPSERVFITQYPDPTTTETGAVTLDCGVSSGISAEEAQWAHAVVVPSLNRKVAEAAARHGWTLADGIPAAFEGHGYCSDDRWVLDIRDTFWAQGDKNGGYHPNYRGHSAYAKEMVRVIKDRLSISGGEISRPLKDRAPRINAFRSLAAGGPASRFADFNDASKDGIRRIERTVDDLGAFTEKPDTKFGADPKERTAPDGRVGMRDLRRYRDAWLQRCLSDNVGCPPQGDIALDGAADHVKKDSNLDGCVFGAGATECGAREHYFARADLNGDRQLDPEHEAVVPWKADGTRATDRGAAVRMSDLGVLQAAWTGDASAEGWTKDKLPILLRSGDLQVHADAVLDTGASKATVQVRLKGGDDVGPARTIKRTDRFAVITVPIISANQEFELVTTAQTARGTMSSVSAPFTLKFGEDKAMAACPDVSLDAAPARLAADGVSTSVITATLHKCGGRSDVSGREVAFTLNSTEGGASVTAITGTTDSAGRAQARFTSGTATRDYTVTASVDNGDADPLEADVELSTVPKLQITYVWKQTIDQWNETGSTRWGSFDPVMPDCTAPGMDYCIDTWNLGLRTQTEGGVERRGTLTGAGDRFQVTETVSKHQASSQASWTLSFPDGETEDGGKIANWAVTDPTAYENHTLSGVTSDDQTGGVTVRGLQNVGDLPYHYALYGSPTGGTIDPVEGHVATTQYLLVPKPQPILFGAAPEKSIDFARDGDGFKPFTSCGVLDQDLTTQKGYFVSGDGNAYIPGASSVGRKPTYTMGDRPMPVGPGRLKISYRFAAVASYAGRPAPQPVLPDCEEDNPPAADFEPETADDGPAREGRTVTFHDFSTDLDNDITTYAWDFGDGKTATGATAWHMYDDDGTFQVELTVTDAKGATDTITKEIVVHNEPPEADLSDATGKVGEPLRIEMSMVDPGKADKSHLEWKLSSSNPVFPTISGNDKGGVYFHEFTGVPAGTYPLTLTVTDDDGEKDSSSAVAVVLEDPPPPPPPAPTPTYSTCDPTVSLDAEERNFLDLINEYRAENGLGPVRVSATLTRAAERHANDMAAKDYMAHTGSDGSSPAQRAYAANYPKTAGVGENLAETETAVQSLAAWRASATGHNENMLNPAWKAIGIARAKGRIWRTSNSFGTQLDCAATDAERQPTTAPKLTADATPSSDGAEMQSTGTTEVHEETAPEARSLPADEPVAAALIPLAEAETSETLAAAAESRYGPTIAVARTPRVPRAGRPMTVVNRSRDAAGSPIAATVDFKDSTPKVALAADASADHSYPDSTGTQTYSFEATGKDGANREGSLLHSQRVAAVRPPQVYFTWHSEIPVAGRPYKVGAAAYDDQLSELIPGLEIVFTLGTTTVKATTGTDGVARAEIPLPDVGGEHKITATFEGTPDFKPASAETTVNATVNQPPVADAGGPYVTGEGSDLLLNGTASSNPDPVHFDQIVKWEWDLDGDGAFDDASGPLPERLSGDTVSALVCGGDCTAGTAYPVALKVTDKWEKSHVDTTTLETVADFDLMLGNEVITVVPGQSSHIGVTVIGSKSYTKPVTLSVPTLPPGVTATFSKNPVTPTDVSVLTLTGGSQLSQGTVPIKLQGTDGEITREISDSVKIAFGLVPVCWGTATGRVVDKTTGAPMSGVTVSQGSWGGSGPSTTDASGRYHFDRVPLGTNNAAIGVWVNAVKAGFWDASAERQASCGSITELPDLQMLDKRKGRVTGTVTEAGTGKKLAGVKLRDTYNPAFVFGETGTQGTFGFDVDLGVNNSERGLQVTADLGGYWPESKHVLTKEDVPGTAQFELMKKCQGTIVGGQVLDIDTKLPVADAPVSLYVSSYYSADMTVKSGADGRFTFNRAVDLGYRNAPTSYRVKPEPPSGSPAAAYGVEKYFPVAGCGAEVSDTVYVKVPKPGYGTITGSVTDEETGAALVEDTWVSLCEISCRTIKVDTQGKFAFADVFTGYDGATAMRSVTVSSPGYYHSSAGTLLGAGQTKDLPVKMLKRRYGALTVEVVDSVTKAPVPGASVRDASNCGGVVCLTTDREGKKSQSGIELGDRNAPRGLNLTASAGGYWPQAKFASIKAGETTAVRYELQPECEPARIRGTVVNASTGGPIEGASISGASTWPMYTNAKGEFEIHPVRPGTGNNPRQVWLTASAPGFYSQSKTVTIFCGAQIVVDFGSPTSKTGTLVGKVTDKVTGAALKDAFIGTDFGATARSGVDGTYRIDNVPLSANNEPRDWAVHVSPAGYKMQTRSANVKADVETPLDFQFSSENVTPVADPSQVSVTEDVQKEITVTGTDADAGDTLSYHFMTYPQHGTVSGKLPNVTYKPDANWHGADSFEFIVNDGAANSAKAKVDLTVAPVNDAPEAIDDQLEAQPDATTRFPIAAVLGNDKDVDADTLQVSAVSPWNGGKVSLDGDEIVFTPPAGHSSQYHQAFFQYTASDGKLTDTALVYVKVQHEPKAPVCPPRTLTVVKGQALTGALECTDVNGGPLTYAAVDAPGQGTLDVTTGGAFTYTPPAGYTGETTFTYRATDQGGLASSPATATVKVVETNVLPACDALSVTTAEDTAIDLAPVCTDGDGDTLTIEPVTQPAHGALAGMKYTPAENWHGTDTLTFRARDGVGPSAPATATITVTPANDLPVCQDVTLTTDEDTPADIAGQCADVDGDALTLEPAGQPAHGAVEGMKYTPAANYAGQDAVKYRARDAGGQSTAANVSVTVNPVNDLPACGDLELASDGGPAEVAPSCSDVDADQLTYAIAAQGEKGTASVVDGKLRYVPAEGAEGTDEFRYTASDGAGGGTRAAAGDGARVAVTISRKVVEPPVVEPPVVEPPVVEPPVVKPPVAEVLPEVSEVLLGCAGRSLVLEDVVPMGRKVRFLGWTLPSNAGRLVDIRSRKTGMIVARPTVEPTGRFTAVIDAPRRSASRNLRYDASVGGATSPALKLWRRVQVSGVERKATGEVQISGRVTGPLATRAKDRVIEVRRQVDCKPGDVIARVKPGRDGAFKVTVPKASAGAVYRLATRVRNAFGGRAPARSYSLPRVVEP